jgi:hypothetical protein
MAERIPRIEPIPQRDVRQFDVPRIPGNVIDRLPPPVTQRTPPPVTTQMSPPVVDVPVPDVPTYEPIDFTPEEMVIEEEEASPNAGAQREETEVPQEDTRDLPTSPDVPEIPENTVSENPVIEVPFTEYELPVPRAEQVVLAGTTATATVAVTLLGKALVEQLVKVMTPLLKQLLLRARKALGRDMTPYETQQILAFDQERNLMKRLRQEQKLEKDRQAAEHRLPRHQRILRHRETVDEKTPPV